MTSEKEDNGGNEKKESLFKSFRDCPRSIQGVFDPWQGEPSLRWGEQAWTYIQKADLFDVRSEHDRITAAINLMALSHLYLDFALLAWEETKMPEWSEWATDLGINAFRLGQYLGPDTDVSVDLDADDSEIVPEILEELTLRVRRTIVNALVQGFGGKPGLVYSLLELFKAVNNEEPDEDADPDFLRKHWDRALLNAESDHPPETTSKLLLWVNADCPKVDSEVGILDYPKDWDTAITEKPSQRIEPEFCPPFKVDVTDAYSAHEEDGYHTIGSYPTLEEAIQVARKVVKQSCQQIGSYSTWDFFGEYGLVYDGHGRLVFRSLDEVKNIDGKAVHVENPEPILERMESPPANPPKGKVEITSNSLERPARLESGRIIAFGSDSRVYTVEDGRWVPAVDVCPKLSLISVGEAEVLTDAEIAALKADGTLP